MLLKTITSIAKSIDKMVSTVEDAKAIQQGKSTKHFSGKIIKNSARKKLIKGLK